MTEQDGKEDGKEGTGWMYNQANDIDKDDYLLGKKIGKNFDAEGTMGQLNAVEYDCAPPSIFASKAQHQVDLQRKLVEDPLVAIKKREVEDRKRLLDNPMKMKALQQHIETLQQKKKEMKKKKKKKKKKKHRGSSSEDSDVDLDLKLLQRLQRIEGREAEEDRQRFREQEEKEFKEVKEMKYADVEPDSPTRETRKVKSSRTYTDKGGGRNKSDLPDLKQSSPDFSERRNRDDRDFSERRNRDDRDFSERRNRDFSERRNRRQSPDFSERRNRDDRDLRRPSPDFSERRNRGDVRRPSPERRKRSRSPRRQSRSPKRNRSPSPQRRKRSVSPPQRREPATPPRRNRSKTPPAKKEKKKVDEDEKARKLAEMMSNADWREDQRAKKVNAYRNKDSKEQDDIIKEHDHGFLQREMKKAVATSSVESRILANKHNIQRGVGVMDKNFAKR